LEKLDLEEESLTGFIERFHFHLFGLEIIGEFPLVEGSFQNLIQIDLPYGTSNSLMIKIFMF